MKTILSILVMSSAALASTSAEYNHEKLAYLQSKRTSTVWNCQRGWQQEAVVMFKVSSDASGALSGDTILAVQDPTVCDALQVTCPFVAAARPGAFGRVGNATHQYWATRGKHGDTLVFFSEGAGMKLVSVSNGSTPELLWNLNWFFNEGECRLHP